MRWFAAPHGRGDGFTLAPLSGRIGSGGRGGLRWEELAEEGQSHAGPSTGATASPSQRQECSNGYRNVHMRTRWVWSGRGSAVSEPLIWLLFSLPSPFIICQSLPRLCVCVCVCVCVRTCMCATNHCRFNAARQTLSSATITCAREVHSPVVLFTLSGAVCYQS